MLVFHVQLSLIHVPVACQGIVIERLELFTLYKIQVLEQCRCLKVHVHPMSLKDELELRDVYIMLGSSVYHKAIDLTAKRRNLVSHLGTSHSATCAL